MTLPSSAEKLLPKPELSPLLQPNPKCCKMWADGRQTAACNVWELFSALRDGLLKLSTVGSEGTRQCQQVREPPCSEHPPPKTPWWAPCDLEGSIGWCGRLKSFSWSSGSSTRMYEVAPWLSVSGPAVTTSSSMSAFLGWVSLMHMMQSGGLGVERSDQCGVLSRWHLS